MNSLRLFRLKGIKSVRNARLFNSSRAVFHVHADDFKDSPSVKLFFKETKSDKEKIKEVDAKIGMSILDVAHANDIDLEGACESSIACSTCHVVFENEDLFDSLPEPSEEEDDMLDMAFGLTSTSRLGCQVIVDETLDGATIISPSATRNFYVDGHVPKPH